MKKKLIEIKFENFFIFNCGWKGKRDIKIDWKSLLKI